MSNINLGSNWKISIESGNNRLLIENTSTGSQFELNDNGTLKPIDGPLDLGGTQSITNASSVSTDDLTVGGFTGSPIWQDESGSPYTATASNSINPSGLDSYDQYRIAMVATDNSGNNENVTMQINGDTGSNYRYVDFDGTDNQNESNWLVSNVNGNTTSGVILKIHEYNDGVVGQGSGIGGSAGMATGRNNNVSHPLSQFTFDRGASTDYTVRVWGRDL